MKLTVRSSFNFLLAVFLLLVSRISAQAQQGGGPLDNQPGLFYYFGHQKKVLAQSPSIFYYRTTAVGGTQRVQQKLMQKGVSPRAFKTLSDDNHIMIDLEAAAQNSLATEVLAALKADADVVFIRPALVAPDGKATIYDETFYLKLKPGTSQQAVQALVAANRCSWLKQYPYDNRTFLINATVANNYNGLQMANIFYESGLFEFCEPDFTTPDMGMAMKRDATTPPATDPNYSLQWGLKNNGTAAQFNGIAGCDINAENAWGITKGSAAIKIAVIDEGVQSTHPDLAANMLPGYDGTTNTSGGTAGNPLSTARAHGTNCAGIIAAVADNGIGISGVAPNCKLVPVNVAYSTGAFASSAILATCIDWAWQTGGADVLSNSWGGGTPSSLIHDAIIRATTLGRGGKGSVVVFSSGNADAAVSSPAIFDETIAVGAINMHYQRKFSGSLDAENFWGSNFGRRLDVMAPGVKIASTDLTGTGGYSTTDYYNIFNGTSSAAPHVSGVAALVISQYGALTGKQVREVIEQSCTKVPGYTYGNEADQPNGRWNSETGYGLINAFAALQLAGTLQYCPKPQVAAAGDLFICNGSSVALSVTNPVAGASYQWQLNNLPAGTGTSINAAASGNYMVISTAGCIDTSAVIKVTVAAPLGTLNVNAGSDTAVCVGIKVLIGGKPSATGGTPIIKRERAYGWEYYSNSFVRFNPDRADYEYSVVKPDFLNAADNTAGSFTAGGDFTPQGYYGITRVTNKLVRVDTLTGNMEAIGICNFSSTLNSPVGLTYDSISKNTYILTSNFSNQSQLWTVNLATAQTTLVGTNTLASPIWIAADRSGQLYTLNLSTDKIYLLNKTSGAATALSGVIGVDANYAQDADADPVTDDLWMAQTSKPLGSSSATGTQGSWRLVNKATGTATTISGTGDPLNEIDALAIAGGTYKYQWSPATNLSNDKDANPFFLSSTPGTYTYTLTVTDLCGNVATDQVNVTVNPLPALPLIAYTDTFLNHKRAFADTFQFTKAVGNNYLWLQNNASLGITDSFYIVARPSIDPTILNVKVLNPVTGCTDTTETLNVRYGTGLKMDNNNDELVCDTNFYDIGGPLANYAGSFTKIFRPAGSGKKLKLSFYKLNLFAGHTLIIYDGAGTGGTILGTLNSALNGEAERVYTSTTTDGALTLSFTAPTGGPDFTGGWLAGFRCEDRVLPVTWLYFRGKKAGNQAQLEWATSSELNTHLFVVERSSDGIHYSTIATVAAHGYSNTIQHYSSIDPLPFTGSNYYRLKQLDLDGRASYSTIVKLDFDAALRFVIQPNPVKDVMVITLPAGSTTSNIQSVIYDAQGRVLATQQLGRTTQASIDVRKLPAGSYRIVVNDGDKKYTAHFIKL